MPFTLSHAAAALPFRRFPLIPSAVVIGTLAPDFEYFLLFVPMDRYGHTLIGIFLLTLPLGLLVFWIFHNFVKRPAIMLFPDPIQRRLANHLAPFQLGSMRSLLLVVFSILVGAASHVLWDSFTHRSGWFYGHWELMRRTADLPVLGHLPYYKVFQHASTVLGLGILFLWLVWWYLTSTPTAQPLADAPSGSRRFRTVAALTAIFCTGALVRATLAAQGPAGNFNFREFLVEAVVTATALAWWELVAYGLFSYWTQPVRSKANLQRTPS